MPETTTTTDHLSPQNLALDGTTRAYPSAEFAIMAPTTGAPPIQPKLTIGAPNDPYEQEADRVAKEVVQRIHSSAAAPPNSPVQRRSPGQDDLQPRLQLKSPPSTAIAGGDASAELESAIHSARGRGQPLAPALQQQMGQAMGADFSGVKVHTDTQSDQLNRSIHAKAFTTGQDIFFRQGAYQPSNHRGQELIAHELTHVVQQNGETVRRTVMPVNELTNAGTSESRLLGPKRKFRALIEKVDEYHRTSEVLKKKLILQEILPLCKEWKQKNANKDKTKKREVVEKLQKQITEELRETTADPELKNVKAASGQTYSPEYTVVDEPLFKPDEPKAEDVKQGALGNCYLLATVVSLAITNPGMIKDMMYDGGTTVTVRLYTDGAPEYIKVTKSIPKIRKVDEEGQVTLIDPYGKGILWVQMLEKAFAASRGGYAKTEGGTGATGISVLTGKASTEIIKSGVDMAHMAMRRSQEPWPYALPGDWMYDDEVIQQEIDEKRRMYPKIFGQQASNWQNFAEDNTHNRALTKGNMHTLEDYVDYIKGKLPIEIAQLAIEYIENAKLYPGKLGTGKYSQDQIVIFDNISRALKEGRVLNAGTKKTVGPGLPSGSGHSGNEPKVKGLVGGHQYAILGAETKGKLKYIKLRNPWGNYGREYSISEETGEMTPTEAQSDNGGIFWIELSDLCDNFNDLVFA